MNISLSSVFDLARFTVQNPRAAARSVLNLGVPHSARWQLLCLVAAGSALLTHVSFTMLPAGAEKDMLAPAMAMPLVTAVLQVGFLFLVVVCIDRIGRWQGGHGTFADALLLVGWLQIVLLFLQFAQVLTFLTLPILAEALGVIGIVLAFWLLTQFIVELHGFKSAWRVFFAILAVIFGLAILLSIGWSTLIGAGV